MTTVGYGNVVPTTVNGKIFTMIYSTIGILLSLDLLAYIVNQIVVRLRPLIWYLDDFSCVRHRCIAKSLIFTATLYFSLFVITILCPAVLFYFIEENWSLFDSIYFCFISTTTIGLGDFVAGENFAEPYKSVYKMLNSLYLFVGITTVMLVLKIYHVNPHLSLSPFND